MTHTSRFFGLFLPRRANGGYLRFLLPPPQIHHLSLSEFVDTPFAAIPFSVQKISL